MIRIVLQSKDGKQHSIPRLSRNERYATDLAAWAMVKIPSIVAAEFHHVPRKTTRNKQLA